MIGMSLVSFLVLLGIGAIVALVFHFVLRYRFLEGWDSVFAKITLGWAGAWLGSPILGHWAYRIDSVYIAPAILGAIVALVLNGVAWKAVAKVFSVQPPAEQPKKVFPTAA